jgi:NitT/TauT family transport system substrate-binding protein
MSRQKHLLPFAFSLVVALDSMTGVAPAAELLKLAYGSPWVGWGPFYVAAEKGFFRQEGVEVELAHVKSNTPQEGLALLTNKALDGRFSTVDEAVLYWRSETPYAVMLVTDVSAGGDGVLMRKDRNIASIRI